MQIGRNNRGEKKQFARFTIDFLKNIQQINAIKARCTEAGENEEDINMDLHKLRNIQNFSALNVYYKALIFSQLYQVKIKKGTHILQSLADLAKQRNRKQSFVSYHDIGSEYH